MADQPWIAIVGSAEPARAQELGLRNPTEALQAAAEIGAELANRGCRIVIYSFETAFIECRAVQGYLGTGKAKSKSIRLIYPHDSSEPGLGDCEPFRDAFDFVPDPRSAWEISFYESLTNVDGLVLVGGGRSTMVAGILSIINRRPIVTLAGYGGAAADVWRYLPATTVVQEERNLMAQPKWSAQSAARCVAAVLRQRDQLLEEAAEQQRQQERAKISELRRQQGLAWQSWAAAGLLVVATATAAFVWNSPPPSRALILLLFLSPFITGISGAMFRRIFDDFRGVVKSHSPTAAVSALGLAAGGLTGLVYVVAQLTAFPGTIEGAAKTALDQARVEHASRILPTAMVTGFVAGLTLDAVFRKFIKGNGLNRSDAES